MIYSVECRSREGKWQTFWVEIVFLINEPQKLYFELTKSKNNTHSLPLGFGPEGGGSCPYKSRGGARDPSPPPEYAPVSYTCYLPFSTPRLNTTFLVLLWRNTSEVRSSSLLGWAELWAQSPSNAGDKSILQNNALSKQPRTQKQKLSVSVIYFHWRNLGKDISIKVEQRENFNWTKFFFLISVGEGQDRLWKRLLKIKKK